MIIVSSVNLVSAEEYPEITDDIEFRYKWYKEVIVGDYYPKKDITTEDTIDEQNIQYGKYSDWKEEYCALSSNDYLIEKKTVVLYEKVYNGRYIMLENYYGNLDRDIKIYQNNKQIKFNIISTDEKQIKIDLNNHYMCQNLMFFIVSNTNYTISIYRDSDFRQEIISKEIQDEGILIPDKTWITEKTVFFKQNVEKEYQISDLMKELSRTNICRYREKYVYKYEIKKEYYDNNYHLYIDGYIKDAEDYKVFYKGNPTTNTIEIIQEKIVTIPQIEYIYIENEKDIQEIDSSQETKCLTKIKTEIIEKEIFKTPKKIYIIIISLVIIVIFLMVKLYKKYVE